MDILNHESFKVTDDILASKEQRFLNFIIDRIVFYLIFFTIGILLVLFFSIIGFEKGVLWMENLENIGQGWDYLISYTSMYIYFFVMESLLSKTIGKAITRTLVVYENGDKPELKDIAIRTLVRFVPFDAFSFLGTLGNGWHDKWSNTFVVKEDLFNDSKRLHKRFNELGE
ncbi:MAG TPA: RDD family protein [Lutibacter sp.]|nr:RDD family protein [Lutibacter sp.]